MNDDEIDAARGNATDKLLQSRFGEVKKGPGRPKKVQTVTEFIPDLTDATLWREGMLTFLRNFEVKTVNQLDICSMLADQYVAAFKKKFK